MALPFMQSQISVLSENTELLNVGDFYIYQ